MKMTPADYEALKNEVTEVLHHAAPDIAEHYKWAKLSDKRLRWDALYAIPFRTRQPLMGRLYTYLDDSHIDTALRRIFGHRS